MRAFSEYLTFKRSSSQSDIPSPSNDTTASNTTAAAANSTLPSDKAAEDTEDDLCADGTFRLALYINSASVGSNNTCLRASKGQPVLYVTAKAGPAMAASVPILMDKAGAVEVKQVLDLACQSRDGGIEVELR